MSVRSRPDEVNSSTVITFSTIVLVSLMTEYIEPLRSMMTMWWETLASSTGFGMSISSTT